MQDRQSGQPKMSALCAAAALTRAPSLTRHSITRAPPLALEAGDASSEMVEPPKPGTPSDWWRSLRTTTGARQQQPRSGGGRPSSDKRQPKLSRGSGGGGGGAEKKG